MRALLILGPTASGKSALAMAIAARRAVEIISVDSAQVYRGLDVGTAKPSITERERVPHHLIDIVEPTEPYSAARFVVDAERLIEQIRQRGRLPLLVGGTMLYAKALLEPFDALPPADPAIRQRLGEEAAAQGLPALHRRLARLDPIAGARIEPGDSQRIQRALEVIEITGMALSRQQSRTQAGIAAPVRHDVSLPILSLEPSDRAALHRRIEQRFDQMLARGLVDEVRGLMARQDLHLDLPALRSVGYRQIWQFLSAPVRGAEHGKESAPGSTAAMRDAAIAATRQLAKRQLTWLRSLPVHHRLDCLDPDLPEQASAIIDVLCRRTPMAAGAAPGEPQP